MSLCFVALAAWSTWGDWWNTRGWQKVEAHLESCTVTLPPEHQAEAVTEGDGRAFQFHVSYRYEYDGRTFTSDRWRRDSMGSDEYEPFGRAEARLRAAQPLYCLVNPDKPDEAVLERRSEGLPLVIFGLGFFLVGVGVIIVTRKASRITDFPGGVEEASPFGSLLLSGAFVSIFLAGGLFICWQGISAIIGQSRAKTWPETPCEIIRTGWNNEAKRVLYRYTMNGETILCDRVRPGGGMNFSSDSPLWKLGAHTTCSVDPSDPRSAVLVPEAKGWPAILFSVPGRGRDNGVCIY